MIEKKKKKRKKSVTFAVVDVDSDSWDGRVRCSGEGGGRVEGQRVGESAAIGGTEGLNGGTARDVRPTPFVILTRSFCVAAATSMASLLSGAFFTAGPAVALLTRILSVHTSRTLLYAASGPRGLRQSSDALPRASASSSTDIVLSLACSAVKRSKLSAIGPSA